MKKKILVEATGSLGSVYMINSIIDSGHSVCGSDVDEFNAGKYFCNDYIVFPSIEQPDLWDQVECLVYKHAIDVVIPSFDEMMLGWAKRQKSLMKKNIFVIISPVETIKMFQDKWETYNFFKCIGVPTPATSIGDDYELIKPRFGRGGKGIYLNDGNQSASMEGMISQEKIKGKEYTIDVLFDAFGSPIYIVPRIRLDVRDGKSVKGIVVKNDSIEQYIKYIATQVEFKGPINFQCFEEENGDIKFIEVNPRLGSGTALSFKATENWVPLIINNFVYNQKIKAGNILYGKRMVRYYAECFI